MRDPFWLSVRRAGIDECWPWAGTSFDKDGYGLYSVKFEGAWRLFRAHRFAFRLIYGYWPEPFGLHGCDNPPCCNAENPLHVHQGTAAQNVLEMHARGRQPRHKGPGELNAYAHLTWDRVGQLRERYAAGGVTQRQLAVEFGIDQSQVSTIVRNRQWVV